MERSGPEDARDDAPDDGWDDDATVYPPAPIPAHERTWRHPSEIGHDAWITSEPPVTIGRGLLVTSGAIGSALGVAILYLLLPAGGASPSAAPEATSSVASLRSPVVQVADEPLDTSTLVTTSTEAPTFDAPHFTLPAGDTPSTVLVMAVERSSEEPVSVAVAIEGDPYVITTANALASIGAVDLLGPGDGADTDRMSAELVSVEGELAYLAPSAQMEVVSFAATATAEPGQTVTVLADDPAEVVYPASGSTGGVPGLDAGRIVEGTPVIDAQGALVALCTVTIDADGAYVEMISVTGDGVDDTGNTGDADDGDGGTGTIPSDVTPTSDPAAPAPTPSGGSTPPTSSAAPTPSVATSPGGSTPAGPFGPVTTSTTTTAPTNTSVAPPSTASGAPDPTGNAASQGAPTATTPSTGSAPAAPSATTTTIARGSSTGTVAWAGLRFDGAPASAPLTVTNVVAASPAFSAGVTVGDRIVAIDGVAVATVEELTSSIKRHVPGDVVKLTVVPRPAGTAGTAGTSGATRVISVVLAAYAPAV